MKPDLSTAVLADLSWGPWFHFWRDLATTHLGPDFASEARCEARRRRTQKSATTVFGRGFGFREKLKLCSSGF